MPLFRWLHLSGLCSFFFLVFFFPLTLSAFLSLFVYHASTERVSLGCNHKTVRQKKNTIRTRVSMGGHEVPFVVFLWWDLPLFLVLSIKTSLLPLSFLFFAPPGAMYIRHHPKTREYKRKDKMKRELRFSLRQGKLFAFLAHTHSTRNMTRLVWFFGLLFRLGVWMGVWWKKGCPRSWKGENKDTTYRPETRNKKHGNKPTTHTLSAHLCPTLWGLNRGRRDRSSGEDWNTSLNGRFHQRHLNGKGGGCL